MLQSPLRSPRYEGYAAPMFASMARSSVAVTPAPGASDSAWTSASNSTSEVYVGRRCYPRPTVRLIEIRLLEGPSVYRLEPVAKLEVAIGRRRSWYGRRDPEKHAL